VWISGIETEGVAFAGSDELWASDAEGGVGAGVAEVPGELDTGDFDLQGRERGSGVPTCAPETLGFDRKSGKEHGEQGEGKVLDAPEVPLRWVAAREKTDEEDEVCEGEEGKRDPEIEEEMLVEGWAVGAGVVGERPREDRHRRMLRGEERGHRIRILRVGVEMSDAESVRQIGVPW
jgi:hypothetical protein